MRAVRRPHRRRVRGTVRHNGAACGSMTPRTQARTAATRCCNTSASESRTRAAIRSTGQLWTSNRLYPARRISSASTGDRAWAGGLTVNLDHTAAKHLAG
jgi:hypothetical protein